MASKVVGRFRSWPPGWRILFSLVMAAGIGVMLIRTVQAVHDLNFELDGNTVNDNGVSLGTSDWNDMFDSAGATKNPLPANFSAAGLVRDFQTNANGSFNTSDDTTFATGSKDTLPISGWQCNHDSNVN